jgi:hypothetical protein
LKQGSIFDVTGSLCRIPSVRLALRWHERAAGLLGLPRLQRGEGLLIDACRSIHTVGMRYPIDAIFIDSAWSIVKVVRDLSAFRFSACLQACMTLELCAGEAARLGLAAGQRLQWKDT